MDKSEINPVRRYFNLIAYGTLLHPAIGASLFFGIALNKAWQEAIKEEPIDWEARYWAEKANAQLIKSRSKS